MDDNNVEPTPGVITSKIRTEIENAMQELGVDSIVDLEVDASEAADEIQRVVAAVAPAFKSVVSGVASVFVEAATSAEVCDAYAKGTARLVVKLQRQGFSRAEAIQIICRPVSLNFSVNVPK